MRDPLLLYITPAFSYIARCKGSRGWLRGGKNLFWWLSTLPILSTGTLVDAARATLILAAVSGVYYWRARTEERHLCADPVYRDYSAWMSRRAPVPRFFRWVGGR